SNVATRAVTVANVAPTVTLAAGNDLSVDEGSTHSYSYTIFDPGQDAVSAVTTSCSGTGSKLDGSDAFTNTAGSFSCSFADGPNSSIVSAAATDEDGDTGAASTQTVTVANVAPRVSLTGPNAANEGETKTYTYTVNDPGQDTFSVISGYPSCGSNGVLVPGSSSTTAAGGSFKCHFPDGPKQSTVAIKVEDEDGAMSVADTEAVDIIDVAIANVAPTLTAPSGQSADEGTSKSFDLGSFSDDGVDDAPWTVAVDWGDGSPAESFTTNSQGAISHSHTYADNGSYTVKVKVTDKDGAASAEKTFEVAVANVAPSLTAPANQTGNEGTGKSFDLGSFSDGGANDSPWSVAVDWGDSSSESFTTGSQGAIARSHAYDDNGTYTVKVKVTDKDGGASEEKTFDVSVANVPPTATFIAPNAVDEGSAIQISLTDATDVSSADRDAGFTYAFNCGSGYGAFSGDNTASCATNDNGTRTVKGMVRDKDGGEREYAKDMTVNNVPPSATFNAPSSVDEGSPIGLSLTDASDPSSADFAAGFTYAFDCGDGGGYGAFTASSSTSCPTTDNGSRTVRGKIRDKDLGEREYTKQVTVGNLAPQVVVTSPEFGKLYAKPATVAMSASFTDAGTGDTHTCSFNWDDGTSSAGAVAEANGSGTCSGTHTFTNGGVYTIKVTVTDDDGASTTVEWMIVVYDPNAGFITGGGWIDVAAGSYAADPTLSGRANFGFNSQYKKGASVPTGETEFNFQVASFKFHSSKYEYLVVSGYKAQYKGTGEVNGVPGYSFRLTVYDGALMNPKGPDKFRIKIMDATGVIFDNRVGKSDDLDLADPQAISAGSIVIHKA
ncbi:MAG: PKD domain-containing protein, partial [Gaiellaceae bacterium]